MTRILSMFMALVLVGCSSQQKHAPMFGSRDIASEKKFKTRLRVLRPIVLDRSDADSGEYEACFLKRGMQVDCGSAREAGAYCRIYSSTGDRGERSILQAEQYLYGRAYVDRVERSPREGRQIASVFKKQTIVDFRSNKYAAGFTCYLKNQDFAIYQLGQYFSDNLIVEE